MPVCCNGPSAYRYVTPLAAVALEQLNVLQRTGAAFACQCGYLSGYARISCWLDVTGSQASSSVGVDAGVVIATR